MTSDQQERLEELEDSMKDDLKYWKEAEAQLIEAKEWRDKMALNYANSAVKFFNAKNND